MVVFQHVYIYYIFGFSLKLFNDDIVMGSKGFCAFLNLNIFRNKTCLPDDQVKYRMEGNRARTTSMYDGEAKEIAHVKRVSELISKVSCHSSF